MALLLAFISKVCSTVPALKLNLGKSYQSLIILFVIFSHCAEMSAKVAMRNASLSI